jgi:7-carboxy-7-deazaguanine synthase
VSKVRVSEIFGPVVQGEGAVIGAPTLFVRLGGCDFRCSWCDTPYAVLSEHRASWTPMDPADVVMECLRLSGHSEGGHGLAVTLSGGNPCVQDCTDLVDALQAMGFSVVVETQGSVHPAWLAGVDLVTVSPKPPSSGMADKFDAEVVREIGMHALGETALKIVVGNDVDFQWALGVIDETGHAFDSISMQVLNDYGDELGPSALLERYRWLEAKVLDAKLWRVRVLPQLHVLAYGDARGV